MYNVAFQAYFCKCHGYYIFLWIIYTFKNKSVPDNIKLVDNMFSRLFIYHYKNKFKNLNSNSIEFYSVKYWFIFYCLVFDKFYPQGYSQMMRLQRRLYRIYLVYFLLFIIPSFCKFCFFFCQHCKLSKNYIERKTRNLTLGLSYLKSFRSSLQSDTLRVKLYNMLIVGP